MNTQERTSSRLNYLWLTIGSILLIFMGGKWNIPATTWLGPVFLLRFFRRQEKWRETLIALPIIALSMIIFVYKLAPFPPVITLDFYLFIVIGNALLIVIPYLVDRALSRKLHHPLSVLIFPSVVTTIHYLNAAFGPLGTAGIWGQNLFDFTSLLQVISITGIWGLSFLVGWFASTINALWENDFNIARLRRPVVAFSVVLCLILLLGGLRLCILKPSSETVKVGSVVVPWPEEGDVFWDYVQRGTPGEEAEKWRPALRELQDELFAQSEGIIPSGVEILMWSVGNVTVFEDDEPAFIQRAQSFAKEHQIYFFPSILMLKPDQVECENKVLAITPEGEIAYTYHKARPSPAEPLPETEGKLLTVDTPYGRISTAICYDMFFSDLIRQAGKQHVDILLVPADEPMPDLDPFDTQSAMFRGIENGCSVLRSTLEGLTMGVDYQGNVLSRMSYYTTTENRTTITHMPTQGVRTVYALAGDWFAYAAILLLAGVTVWAVSKKSGRGMRGSE